MEQLKLIVNVGDYSNPNIDNMDVEKNKEITRKHGYTEFDYLLQDKD